MLFTNVGDPPALPATEAARDPASGVVPDAGVEGEGGREQQERQGARKKEVRRDVVIDGRELNVAVKGGSEEVSGPMGDWQLEEEAERVEVLARRDRRARDTDIVRTNLNRMGGPTYQEQKKAQEQAKKEAKK